MSGYTKLRIYLLASVIKLINSTFPIFSSNHYRAEFCTSNCIPAAYSNTSSLIISISNPAFFYFLTLNCRLIYLSVDRNTVYTVNMENNIIVINPSTSGISISLDFPSLKDYQNLVNDTVKIGSCPIVPWF